MKEKTIAIVNQKGGVGKTTTTLNLGREMEQEGKKVLLIDFDPQGSLSLALGIDSEELSTISDLMSLEMQDRALPGKEEIIQRVKGMDIIPSNIVLSAAEVSLVNTTCREMILKSILEQYKHGYDYILVDCGPSLGMLTINALTAADSVLIPASPEYLSAKGLELLLQSIAKIKRKLNPALEIEGILLTMVQERTNLSRAVTDMIEEAYGKLYIYNSKIPRSVAVGSAVLKNVSIMEYQKNNKAAQAYHAFAQEVMKHE